MAWAKLLVPFFNVLYVVIAIMMTALILMQRGAGAQAGSGFGAGASGTVFGSQGSANFLSRSTSVCATIFFLISFGMGVYISHGGREGMRAEATPSSSTMGGFSDAAKAAETPAVTPPSAIPGAAPAAPATAPIVIPSAVPAASSTPAAPAIVPVETGPVNAEAPVPAAPQPVPAPNQ